MKKGEGVKQQNRIKVVQVEVNGFVVLFSMCNEKCMLSITKQKKNSFLLSSFSYIIRLLLSKRERNKKREIKKILMGLVHITWHLFDPH